MRVGLVVRPHEVRSAIANLGDDFDSMCRRFYRQARRQETPIIQMFEMRPMSEAGPAAALIDGPSHDTCLPGRPPNHRLRPSRESVVNALLPCASGLRLTQFSHRAGHGAPLRSAIESGHSERKQRLLETDHLSAYGLIPRSIPFGRELPPHLRGRPGRGESSAVRGVGRGRSTPASRLPRTAIRTGPPVSDRPESFRTIHGAGDRQSPALTDAAPIASGLPVARRAPFSGLACGSGRGRRAPFGLVSHLETT